MQDRQGWYIKYKTTSVTETTLVVIAFILTLFYFIIELWNISNVIRINLMHVIVPLCMMTWSNTLVTPVNVFFVLLYSFILWIFFFSMCLVLSDVYWHVSYSDAIDTEMGSVEWICMDACMYVCTDDLFFLLAGANGNYTLMDQ